MPIVELLTQHRPILQLLPTVELSCDPRSRFAFCRRKSGDGAAYKWFPADRHRWGHLITLSTELSPTVKLKFRTCGNFKCFRSILDYTQSSWLELREGVKKSACRLRIGGYPIPIHPLCINGSRNFSNKKSSLGNLCFCKISQLENLRSIVLMEKWRMKCVFSNSILKNLNPQLVSAIKWLAVSRAIASKYFLSTDRWNWWSFASLNSSPCPDMNVFSHLADERWTLLVLTKTGGSCWHGLTRACAALYKESSKSSGTSWPPAF